MRGVGRSGAHEHLRKRGLNGRLFVCTQALFLHRQFCQCSMFQAELQILVLRQRQGVFHCPNVFWTAAPFLEICSWAA